MKLSDVSVKIMFLSKFQVTFKWFLAFVHCFKRCLKAIILSKFCEAKGTFKWPHSFMNCPNVNLEIIFVSEC